MSTVAHLDDSTGRIPPLVAGDRLTRDEFERRYDAMPEVKKARDCLQGIMASFGASSFPDSGST